MSRSSREERQQEVAKRLKRARELAGLTQQQAATLMRRPQSYVSRCESGARRLDISELEEFANLYNQPIGYLIKR